MWQLALLLLTIAVAHASVTVTRTSDDGTQPSTMEIEVQLPDSTKTARIPLTRTDAFENVPMTVMENGVSRTFSAHQLHHASHSHYRDIASKSVISVRHVNGKRQISGHVMHEGTSYFLEPVGDSEHRVTKNVMNPELMARQIDVGKLKMQSRRKRQSNTSPTTYTVEIYLLIDSTVWSTFQTIYGAANATTELHFYYTHILNGIDTAYRNIGTPSISVSCIEIFVSKTLSDDAWMPGSLVGNQILSKMTSYIVDKTADHFMAFTRKDITDSAGQTSVCGMAYVGGACKSTRVSINEDKGLHCWGTAAHELGHNLGSQHDNGGVGCSPGSQFLMAPSTGFYDLSNVANSYRFSPCTVTNITNYINSLASSSTGNCLLTALRSRRPELSAIGPRVTLDQGCRLAYPNSPGTFYVDSSASPASICASIFCKTSSGGGTSSGGLRAPVGTKCGNYKSCNWNGECTADSTVGPANEACFWGDLWGATNCQSWKNAIAKGYESCDPVVTAGCCSSLTGLC